MIEDTQLAEIFDSQIRIPPMNTLRSLEIVFKEVELFSSSEFRKYAMGKIEQAGFAGEDKLNVGVKKLLSVVEMARQETDERDRVDRLVSELRNLHL